MNSKRSWSFIGLFIIALVVSLPFYSANVLAVSVQITRNSGQAGIPKFLDAQGDVWIVETTINGAAAPVTPPDVKLKVGENEASFTSCSDGPLGVTCEYIVPLTEGLAEGEYSFQVLYRFLNALGMPEAASNGDVVKADGSGPQMEVLLAQQNQEGKVELDFTVKDKVISAAPGVGIKTIEILDADTAEVLQTISLPDLGVLEWNYKNDGDSNGILPVSLSGEGLRRLKFRATDWLGHKSAVDPLAQFPSDFVAPAIQEKLEFPDLGKFIGEITVTSDMTVDIQETTLREVTASSAEAELENTPATECLEDAEQEKLWHCRWDNLEVTPAESVTVKVMAKDDAGNVAEKTLTATMVKDSSAPTIDFFGTERTFEGKNFLRSGKQRIILRVDEQGAGMDIKGVQANLEALGVGSGTPTACEQTETTFNCYWEFNKQFVSSGTARIDLIKLEDKVGNQGELPQLELFIDVDKPKVDRVEVWGFSEIGEKDYFQSNDRVKLKIKAAELTGGIVVLLNVNDLVMDAENLYPESDWTRDFHPADGWQIFPESCFRVGEGEEGAGGGVGEQGEWRCELETEAIKSGPDPITELEIKVQDTAGNDAQFPDSAKNVEMRTTSDSAILTFPLLALSDEASPDYWEVQKGYPKAKLSFVDLDVTELTYARMPLDVKLRSDQPQAKVLMIEIEGCDPAEEGAPELSRALLYGGNKAEGAASPTATMVLEFNPFNGREFFNIKAGGPFVSEEGKFEKATAAYTCHLRVFSKVGETALRSAERQDVPVEVTFAFTDLGALDESLANRVKDLKESGWMKFFDAIGTANTVLQWLNYIANALQTLHSVLTFFSLFSDSLQATGAAYEKTGVGAKIGPILRSECAAVELSKKPAWKWIETMQIPLQILTCTPGVFSAPGNITAGKIEAAGAGLTWYAVWQRNALETYNLFSGRTFLAIPATTLYENMYASALGLCVPGIVYNLNKAREIYCRKIVCYGKEIPAGYATMESCDRLYSLQMCEWVLGPAFDFALLGGIASWGNLIKSFFTSPLGLISLGDVLFCMNMCWKPEGTPATMPCNIATGLNKLLDMINSVYTSVKQRPDVTVSPYCKMAEDIDIDELTGGEVPLVPEDEEEPQPATGY